MPVMPPISGLRGNSHMPMMDRNHQQIVDLVHAWLDTKLATAHTP